LPAFRFVHTADLHIDSPVRGLSSRNEKIGQRVRDAGYQALDNLVNLCITEQVDFLLIAGDVYDGAIRTPQAQIRFKDALAKLTDAGIESFVVHGNHDPLDGRFSSIAWPDGVHVYDRTDAQPEWRQATKNGVPLAEIQGISFPTQVVGENLASRFKVPQPGIFSIGLLHCNLGGDTGHDNYAPCSITDLTAVGIDYWALGHIHKREVVRQASPTIIYPGNIQGRDSGEMGERGCYLVDVSEAGVVTPMFRPLDVVRWTTLALSIDDVAGVDGLRDRLVDQLTEKLREAHGRDVICRVTLVGRGELHAALQNADDREGFLEQVREDLDTASPWVWIEKLADQTRPDIDLDERIAQDDFLGEALSGASKVECDEVRDSVARVFSGRPDGLPKLDDDQIAELIEEAQWYLVDLLEGSENAGGRT
jgi:DNA repair exonuclease SbcCD nuclease subunit